MHKQKLKQNMKMNLTPQQIQFLSLLQIPLPLLSKRIEEELEKNPALEEEEIITNINSDKFKSKSYSKFNTTTINSEIQIANQPESLQDFLKKQVLLLNLNEEEFFLVEYLIDSLDENGWINRDFFSISDDIFVNFNLEFQEDEIRESLNIIQNLDPPGIGTRDLRESLIIQLKRKDNTEIIDESILVLEKYYEMFVQKNYEFLINKLEISKEKLRQVYNTIENLNPLPAANFNINRSATYIIVDFIVDIENEKNIVTLNKISNRKIKVSDQYHKILSETKDLETINFLKQKIESANWFTISIIKREETLLKVMNAIVEFQEKYFLTGDEKYLKPMILSDIALLIDMDISTISRVTNSKYVETFFGTLLLKDLFSEAYRKDNGELVSTKLIKNKLKELIDLESKHNPYTDDQLCALLGEEDYHISRRTVSKYRSDLGIEKSKYRRII
tara:strand:+ start:10295 stop:11635 length:1341 start_codon:yes stop_codon:yes gene_type:complete